MKNAIITILAMIVLVLGGYLIYDKVVSKDNKNITDKETSKAENLYNQTTYSLKKGSKFQRLYGENVEIYVDKGQVYLTYKNNYTGVKADEITANLKNHKMQAYSTPDSESIECYKVEQLNNVVAAYVTYTGNSGDAHFAFILDDGKVALINEGYLNYNKVLNVQISTSLKNIVTIVQNTVFGAYEAYAIDINGNEFSFASAFNLEY